MAARPEPGVAPLGELIFAIRAEPVVVPAYRTGREIRGHGIIPATVPDGSSVKAGLHWLTSELRSADSLNGAFIWAESPVLYRETVGAPPDDTAAPFYLLPPIEEPSEGGLTIDGESLKVTLLPRPDGDLRVMGDWMSGPRLMWPDPSTPLEAFRRRLLLEIDAARAIPTEPPGPLVTALARQNSLTWIAGLQALKQVSPGVHAELVETLTRRVRDGAERIAAWPTDRERLRRLEELLVKLIDSNAGETHARMVMGWIDQGLDSVAWIESDHGEEVRLAVANLTRRPLAIGLSWADVRDVRQPLLLSPFSVSRTRLVRPRLTPVKAIRIDSPGRSWLRQVGPSVLRVMPPGLSLHTFEETWRLSNWLDETASLAPANHATTVTVRRIQQHWEIFVEATGAPLVRRESESRIADSSRSTTEDTAPAARLDLMERRHWSQLAGVEAITLFAGPMERPDIILTTTPEGAKREWTGAEQVNDFEIITSVRDDGVWTARFRLPASWNDLASLDIGFLRTCRDRAVGYASPRASLPWRPNPGRWRLDLTGWTEFPQR